MKVAPSILAADFAHLDGELQSITEAGADWVHIDVMDGIFVPNISLGIPVVEAMRPCTELPFDVHLMIVHPKKYVPQFCKAGADIISFHVEADDDPAETIDEILRCGAKPALVIKPDTPAEAVYPYLDKLYMVLVMTVEPGFGGQRFRPAMLEKVRAIKQRAPQVLIEVDGGINPETVKESARAGVDVCVAGTAVFRAEDPEEAIRILREA